MPRKLGEAWVAFTYGAAVSRIALPGGGIFYANPNYSPTRNNTPPNHTAQCPVCLCTPVDPFKTICGHTYCKQCFVDQCAQHSTEFPIRCLAYHEDRGECSEPLSPYDLQGLPSDVLENLFKASFRQCVRSHPAQFRYCPIPACSRLNFLERPPDTTATIDSTTTITCNGCGASFCLSCNSAAHPSRTCEQAGNNASLDDWKSKNGAKDCPKCGVTTIKAYGCNHIQCAACMAHFCWHCLASFEDSAATCEHLDQVHGDWGIDMPLELPVPPEILVRVAERCHVAYPDLLERWDTAAQNPPRITHRNDTERQPDVHHNGDAARTQPEPSPRGKPDSAQPLSDPNHPDFAFHYLLRHGSKALMDHAHKFDNPRDSFIKYVRDISNFLRSYPDVASHALLNNIDRLDDIENILHLHIGDGVGARLRVTLDRFYENGFYEALFEKLLGEGRQMVAVNHIEHAVADMMIAQWGEGEG
ncbi:hypothetical protein P171DRAFT_162724 [Karstenula rhodostoma CBS 690.94]|uniref:RBR-type E3 ubiquitin transferase n=1 Tax=Karstenula rhodostoma CBS 690.94 TaxID=1392251 RepID=A0A9P4P6S9_9PLEO|nr:hypothetical protein P171DRAFT_162724 [Karstenula rhodostoma CBS 690.94]